MKTWAPLLVLAGYLLGSLSFAVLLVRWKTGKDIRTEGSDNAGATNVLRAHGKGLALAVALLDVAKGAAAVGLTHLFTANPTHRGRGGRRGRPRARLSALLRLPRRQRSRDGRR